MASPPVEIDYTRKLYPRESSPPLGSDDPDAVLKRHLIIRFMRKQMLGDFDRQWTLVGKKSRSQAVKSAESATKGGEAGENTAAVEDAKAWQDDRPAGVGQGEAAMADDAQDEVEESSDNEPEAEGDSDKGKAQKGKRKKKGRAGKKVKARRIR